jgi:hypothetical protein
MLYPCTRHLDDSIVQLTRTSLSIDALQAHLTQALSEKDAIPLEGFAITPHKIADELGATCALIFQQAVCSLQSPIQSSTQSPTQNETQPQPTNLAPLNRQITRLCVVWAYGRKQQMPEATCLAAQWQHPALQATLRHTSAQLRQSSPYGEWIDRYPTCWAYTFGLVMHQLLQWNHRLTPTALRELWP